MKFLSLCSLAGGVFGAVSQHCAGFEVSRRPRELVIKVKSDSNVFLYHLTDVASSNIPSDINDDILQSEPDGFSICTHEKVSKGLCDAMGTFSLKFDGAHQDLVNKFIQAGEKASLNISEEGLYCAVIYQEGAEMSYIELIEKHSYGYLPLPLYWRKGALDHLNNMLMITYFAMEFIFKDSKAMYDGAVSKDILSLISAKKYQILFNILFLAIQNSLEAQGVLRVVNIPTTIDTIYLLITFMLYYKSNTGIFGFDKKKTHKTATKSCSKTSLFLMIFSGIVVSLQPALHKICPQQLLLITNFFSQIVLSNAWILMAYIMWNSYNTPQTEIENPIFAKKNYLSQLCLFWTPITTSIISLAGVMVIMISCSKDIYSHSGSSNDYMQAISFHSMESSLNQNCLFVLLKHFPEFSILLVEWSLFFIWRPSHTKMPDIESILAHDIVEEIKE